ncbi:MAG: L-threonylcarbamoyladenylate synthase [Bacteroidia bacterium]|nr:L-threonylcarbamoyladenylate synthase [Bacteroidia bacterium]
MEEDIRKAIEVLRSGGTILYPTDTVWGIGCDATNPDAVEKIFTIKKREGNHSMLILVDAPLRIEQYVKNVPEIAWDLMDVSDTPLTIIYNGAKNLAPNLTGSDGSIGIRVTSDEFCIKLISRFKKPIVSTSANLSGMPFPADFTDINPDIIKSVGYIVSWRQDDKATARPSSIIKLGEKGEIKIIRK